MFFYVFYYLMVDLKVVELNGNKELRIVIIGFFFKS